MLNDTQMIIHIMTKFVMSPQCNGGALWSSPKNPSRAPRNSKFGTDFRKNPLCSYTKIRIASCRNREVRRGQLNWNWLYLQTSLITLIKMVSAGSVILLLRPRRLNCFFSQDKLQSVKQVFTSGSGTENLLCQLWNSANLFKIKWIAPPGIK